MKILKIIWMDYLIPEFFFGIDMSQFLIIMINLPSYLKNIDDVLLPIFLIFFQDLIEAYFLSIPTIHLQCQEEQILTRLVIILEITDKTVIMTLISKIVAKNKTNFYRISNNFIDALKLIDISLAREYWLMYNKLAYSASKCPYVYLK